MRYYSSRRQEDVTPDLGGFYGDWTRACKNGNPSNTACNFECSTNMIEMMALGLVAYRAGGKLD